MRLLVHRHPTIVRIGIALVACCSCTTCWGAKNVILMVADGAGNNTWLAASMYQGKVGRQIYDQPGWVHWSCSTYPLNRSNQPTGGLQQDADVIYDPLKAWNDEKQDAAAGYAFLTTTATDSAAAATAMATGQKTYDNAINWSNDDRPMRGRTIAEIAHANGKSTGVVSSVPWSHATPAALGGAHNISRNHYQEIANEMLDSDGLDVIMGAGNPDFDDSGRPIDEDKKKEYQYVGGHPTWKALKQGKCPWKLIQSKEDFESLAEGPTPEKVLGAVQVGSTLQEKRGADTIATPYDKITAELSPERLAKSPYAVPQNSNVPTLAVMARAALNCLDDDLDGFFLMIEGGAVDWANHANEPDRMIEEQIDYLNAVEAVVAWVESHGGWQDTLLILTADHETGLIWGPGSSDNAFEPIEDRGAGQLPGMKFHSHGHSNSLVPLYARGPGSERFSSRLQGTDATAAQRWHTPDGYVDNTAVFAVMHEEVKNSRE